MCVCVCVSVCTTTGSVRSQLGPEGKGDGVGGGEDAFLDCSEHLVQNCTKTWKKRLALKKSTKATLDPKHKDIRNAL